VQSELFCGKWFVDAGFFLLVRNGEEFPSATSLSTAI